MHSDFQQIINDYNALSDYRKEYFNKIVGLEKSDSVGSREFTIFLNKEGLAPTALVANTVGIRWFNENKDNDVNVCIMLALLQMVVCHLQECIPETKPEETITLKNSFKNFWNMIFKGSNNL